MDSVAWSGQCKQAHGMFWSVPETLSKNIYFIKFDLSPTWFQCFIRLCIMCRREAVCLPSQLKFLKLSHHHVKPKQTSCVISSLCKSATCQRHLSQLTEEVQLWNSHQNIKTSGLLDPLLSLPPAPSADTWLIWPAGHHQSTAANPLV